jgi:hypothetical protein
VACVTVEVSMQVRRVVRLVRHRQCIQYGAGSAV